MLLTRREQREFDHASLRVLRSERSRHGRTAQQSGKFKPAGWVEKHPSGKKRLCVNEGTQYPVFLAILACNREFN